MSTFRPPTGRTFYCHKPVRLMILAQDLRKVAAFLQASWPDGPLNLFADWWQHDGLHFHSGIIDFHEFFTIIGSPRAIYRAMPGDDAVRVGIAPANGEWYLRFYADWDDDGEQIDGDYDLTLRLAEHFRAEVQPGLQAQLEEADSEDYFKKIIFDS